MTLSSRADRCTLSPTNSWMLVSFLNRERRSRCAHPAPVPTRPGECQCQGTAVCRGTAVSPLATTDDQRHATTRRDPQRWRSPQQSRPRPGLSRQLLRSSQGVPLPEARPARTPSRDPTSRPPVSPSSTASAERGKGARRVRPRSTRPPSAREASSCPLGPGRRLGSMREAGMRQRGPPRAPQARLRSIAPLCPRCQDLAKHRMGCSEEHKLPHLP